MCSICGADPGNASDHSHDPRRIRVSGVQRDECEVIGCGDGGDHSIGAMCCGIPRPLGDGGGDPAVDMAARSSNGSPTPKTSSAVSRAWSRRRAMMPVPAIAIPNRNSAQLSAEMVTRGYGVRSMPRPSWVSVDKSPRASREPVWLSLLFIRA